MMSLCTDDIASWVQENGDDGTISWLMMLLGVIILSGDGLSLGTCSSFMTVNEDWMGELITGVACTGDSALKDMEDGGYVEEGFLVV